MYYFSRIIMLTSISGPECRIPQFVCTLQLVISASESLKWKCEEENNDTRHHDHRH